MDAEAIADLFSAFGPVRTRRMFGGQGIYAGETIFALEAFGDIWLKADDETRPLFEAAGSRPFAYETRNGKNAVMSYWRLPDEAADDPEATARWARLALDAARRAAEAAPRGRARRKR
jgi:DNA transformation protein